MPRDFEEALKAIMLGGARGYEAGQASTRDIEKALMMERIKRMLAPEETELKSAQAEYYRARAKSPLGKLTTLPSGYEIGYDKTGRQILKATKKPSGTELFRENLRKAKQAIRSGESTPEEEISILEDLYPERDFTVQKMQWKGLIPKPTKIQPVGKSLFSRIGERAKGLFDRPDIQSRIEKAQSLGYSDEEINAYLKGR